MHLHVACNKHYKSGTMPGRVLIRRLPEQHCHGMKNDTNKYRPWRTSCMNIYVFVWRSIELVGGGRMHRFVWIPVLHCTFSKPKHPNRLLCRFCDIRYMHCHFVMVEHCFLLFSPPTIDCTFNLPISMFAWHCHSMDIRLATDKRLAYLRSSGS